MPMLPTAGGCQAVRPASQVYKSNGSYLARVSEGDGTRVVYGDFAAGSGIIFSDAGVGTRPIRFIGLWSDIKATINMNSQVKIYVHRGLGGQLGDALRLHLSVNWYVEAKRRAINPIGDALLSGFKSFIMGAAGGVSSGSAGAALARDIGGAAADAVDVKRSIFGSGKPASRLAGSIIHVDIDVLGGSRSGKTMVAPFSRQELMANSVTLGAILPQMDALVSGFCP